MKAIPDLSQNFQLVKGSTSSACVLVWWGYHSNAQMEWFKQQKCIFPTLPDARCLLGVSRVVSSKSSLWLVDGRLLPVFTWPFLLLSLGPNLLFSGRQSD